MGGDSEGTKTSTFRELAPEIKSALSRASAIVEMIETMLEAPFKSDGRAYLLDAFTSQAVEHCAAVLILIESGKAHGSAFALFRPLFETVIRGHWLATCASEGEFEIFVTNAKFKFPRIGLMTDAVSLEYASDFFKSYISQWRHMCGYTHTGFEQVLHRFAEGGLIAASYPTEKIALLAKESARLAGVSAYLFLNLTGRSSLASVLIDSLQRQL